MYKIPVVGTQAALGGRQDLAGEVLGPEQVRSSAPPWAAAWSLRALLSMTAGGSCRSGGAAAIAATGAPRGPRHCFQ